VDPDRYVARLGLDPDTVTSRDCTLEDVARLQRTHVRTVPFENLAIAGHPSGTGYGEGVSLDLGHIYGKVVDRGRGGFCYELNGLFGWLLDELGFGTRRVAARVLDDDGNARPPANHHANLVDAGRRYLVDVGVAVPTIRRPLSLDGGVREDDAGIAWRVRESDRPDADYRVQFREPGGNWTDRYVFRDRPVDLDFFAATCEFLASAPESPFTGEPFVTVATDDGHLKLAPGTLTVLEGGREEERPVDPAEWDAVLERRFGIG
jgi:N-hydroxyarylamine O-acetyltransferase